MLHNQELRPESLRQREKTLRIIIMPRLLLCGLPTLYCMFPSQVVCGWEFSVNSCEKGIKYSTGAINNAWAYIENRCGNCWVLPLSCTCMNSVVAPVWIQWLRRTKTRQLTKCWANSDTAPQGAVIALTYNLWLFYLQKRLLKLLAATWLFD